MEKRDMILILDLGSQENDRLVRELNELGIYSEVRPHSITIEEVNALQNVKGIILNGGPNRMVDGEEKDVALEIYNAPMPVLMVDHKGDDPWPEDEEKRKETLSLFALCLCGAEPAEPAAHGADAVV